MNHEQARIRALLEDSADEFEATGMVDLTVQVELDGLGYPLCQLDRDLNHLIANR